jgi:NAD(P)-dependent dehydrogenase (short-subunit alcohol dehydrogenase family)
MNLVLADINDDALATVARELRATGAHVLPVPTDVSSVDSVSALADAAFAEFGNVHVLCNNAGVGAGGLRSWNYEPQHWQRVLGINLFGVIFGCHAFIPRMLANGDEGHIVNTASMAGLINGAVNSAPYDVSKHGVVALSEGMYKELKVDDARISVSVLCPGWVNTNIGRSMDTIPGVYDPGYIARVVVDGIRDERFYLTPAQAEFHRWMRMRVERLLDGRNPAVPRRKPPGRA